MIDHIIRCLPEHSVDLKTLDFEKSKRKYNDAVRIVKEHMFYTRLPNGEVKRREWLFYSNSTGSVYCVPCKLFQTPEHSNSFSTGFNDWKNSNRISDHEKSAEHRANVKLLITRSSVCGKIDSKLHENYLAEKTYWNQVLKRIILVIKFLGVRGLAFRGSTEKFGCPENGNYMGVLELLSEYDDFLKKHIEKYGNPGSGNVSYLSKTICNEFIELMFKKVNFIIVKELKESKYFSISVDSTPDITHTDQLTVVVRYILPDGSPVERFLGFIPLNDHTAVQMEATVVGFLSKWDIKIEDMRGQSYDNASNMSGKYKGLQALLKKRNNLAEYIPCAGHSLNLVGTHAADCCVNATKFFMFIQNIYVFLSGSTSRWSVIEKFIENSDSKKKLLPKRLDLTRWAAKWHAVRALCLNYWSYFDAIKSIADNSNETNATRVEAAGICKQFLKLETGILLCLWYDILEKFNKSSETLQTGFVDLTVTCKIYQSLQGYVSSLRDKFQFYEQKGKELSKIESYIADKKRPSRRSTTFGENDQGEREFNSQEDMKINTFIVIIDRLIAELNTRAKVYFNLNETFGFLSNLDNLSKDDIRNGASVLRQKYPSDIGDEFAEECVFFKDFIEDFDFSEIRLKSKLGRRLKREKKEESAIQNLPLSLLKLIRLKKLTTLFPNLDIAFRILLCMMASNTSGERSFSILKRILTYLRNSCSDTRLSSLASFAANAELFKSLDFDDLIDEFSVQKARKVNL